jgi:hypothetical protein
VRAVGRVVRGALDARTAGFEFRVILLCCVTVDDPEVDVAVECPVEALLQPRLALAQLALAGPEAGARVYLLNARLVGDCGRPNHELPGMNSMRALEVGAVVWHSS